MGILVAAHGWGESKKAPLPKICNTYSIIMKIGSYTLPREDQKKYMNHMTHPLSSADISIFPQKSATFVFFSPPRNKDIDFNKILIHNF